MINDYARQNKLLKEKTITSTGDDVHEGLTLLFPSNTLTHSLKDKPKQNLQPEVVKITNRLFSDAFGRFLVRKPQIAKKIVEKEFCF